MNDLRKVINDHWVALDTRTHGSSWMTSALPVDSAGLPILCAIGPDGNRHLLVPLDQSHRPRPDIRAAAVHLLPLVLEADSRPVHYANLVLLRADLTEIFTGLCADVMAALATTSTGALTVVSQVLDGWRELLRSGTQLGVEQLAGLFGELSVLNALLDLGPELLSTWRGPLRAPQDFIAGPSAIEVKATASSEGRAVRIHGIDQLDAPSGGLMLWWMRLDTSAEDGTSLPELVRATGHRVSRPRELWELLARSGYFLADDGRYAGVRFSIAEQARYRVAENFPRVVAASFPEGPPAGVSDLRYTVDLDLGPPPMQEHEVSAFLGAMGKP